MQIEVMVRDSQYGRHDRYDKARKRKAVDEAIGTFYLKTSGWESAVERSRLSGKEEKDNIVQSDGRKGEKNIAKGI